MSWKETNVMEQREKFIAKMLLKEKPFVKLCEEFGISEKTGYKWKNRFEESGSIGLFDQRRTPNTIPNSLSEDVVIRIINLKRAHKSWGPKKIHALYGRIYKNEYCPSLSSVKRVLRKANMTEERKIQKANPDSGVFRQHIKAEKPNDVWATDYKGWWKSNGEKCIPLNVRDIVSKKILGSFLVERTDSETCRKHFTELFKKYGLPKVIRSDNGVPFASSHGLMSLTNLSAWWITLGIIPDRTDKGAPGQNGSIERMHKDMANEIEGKISGGRKANQIALDAWVEEYNSVRPNEALGMKTPDEVYTPSERKYTGDCDDIEYPPGYIPRKVFASGEISLYGLRVTISTALRGLTVGLVDKGNNKYDVFLCSYLLGEIDFNSCCFTPLDTV